MSDVTVGSHGPSIQRPAPFALPPPPRPPSASARALAAFRVAHTRPAGGRLLLGTAAIAVLGAGLVAGHRPGLGLAITGALVGVPAAVALARRRAWSSLLTAALAVALVAVVAVRDAPWVVACCLVVAAVAATTAASTARSATAVLLAPLTALLAIPRALRWAGRGSAAAVRRGGEGVLPVLRVAGITVGLLVVFGALLVSADAVLASVLPRPDLALLPGQLVVGALVLGVVLVLASLAVAPPRWAGWSPARRSAARRWEWLIPLLALDALLGAFVLAQLVALLGGDDYVLRTAGTTYAAYARQGFGQLLAATALTLGVVALWARRAPRERRGDRVLARAALGALCLATLGVVAAALGRMALYVQAYGLTELRILAAAAEVVLGVVLLLVMAAGVRWRGRWLPRAAVQVVAVATLALALANPDALIVRYNTQADEAPLDLLHLSSLSVDAVPAMAALPEPLRVCLLARQHPTVDAGWAGWNLSRSQAVAADDVTTSPTGCADVVR